VHNEGIAVADETQELIELGAFGVLAGGLVREDPVQLNALELAPGILVQAADPDISDALPVTVVSEWRFFHSPVWRF
jgi:hypothetical protein